MFVNEEGRVVFDSGAQASPGQMMDVFEFAASSIAFKSDETPWRSGALLTRQKGFWGPARGALKGLRTLPAIAGTALLMAPVDIAISGATARRHHMASSMIGAAGGQIGAVVGGVLGALAGGPIGAGIGGFVGDALTRGPIRHAAQYLAEFSQNVRRLDMGGDYEDTQPAWTMRQMAARELGGSLLNARSYLGQEGLLLHQ